MAKKFTDLLEKMPAESRARARAKADKFLKEMALGELRTARELTQVRLAKKLRVGQPAISKIESNADIYVTTLEKVINAMGGTLEILAVFPGKTVRISQFSRSRGRRRRTAEEVHVASK